jgi:hypothetical protein
MTHMAARTTDGMWARGLDSNAADLCPYLRPSSSYALYVDGRSNDARGRRSGAVRALVCLLAIDPVGEIS